VRLRRRRLPARRPDEPDSQDDVCLAARSTCVTCERWESRPPPRHWSGATDALPAEQRWTCDGPAKNGCFDLCTYDAQAAEPYAIRYSAVTAPDGARCAGAHTPESCNDGDSCDDGNPCTDDFCVPELGCLNRPNTAPCDMGSSAGADQCSGGVRGHAGNHASATCPPPKRATVDACTMRAGEVCANRADDNRGSLIDCADPLCEAIRANAAPSDVIPGRSALPPPRRRRLSGHPRNIEPWPGALDRAARWRAASNARPIYSATSPGALSRRSGNAGRSVAAAQRNRSGRARLDQSSPEGRQMAFRLKAYGGLDAATEADDVPGARRRRHSSIPACGGHPAGWRPALPGER
jgi:hypothetical protein